MTPSQFKRLQKQKLEEQKTKPIQKVSNSFIDSAMHKSNLGTLKTIYYIATVLHKFDHSKPLDTIQINLKEMLKYTEMTALDIRNNLRGMQETSISFIDEKKDIEEYINLLPRIEFKWGKNIVEIDLYSKIAKLIIDAVGRYSFIDTKQLMRLKNKFALKILPILYKISQYDEFVPKRAVYELEDLNNLFGTKYKNLYEIERKILIPAKEELDAESDLSFIYEVNFGNFGQGRPKALNIAIDLIQNNSTDKKTTANSNDYLKDKRSFVAYIRKNFINKDLMIGTEKTSNKQMLISVDNKGKLYDKYGTNFDAKQSNAIWSMLYDLAKDNKLNYLEI